MCTINMGLVWPKLTHGFHNNRPRAAFRGHLPLLTKFLPPCNIIPAQQISFVVKYLSENPTEVISESVKLKDSLGSMPHTLLVGHMSTHPPSWPCAYTHGWVLQPPLFRQIPILPSLGNFSECCNAGLIDTLVWPP